MTRGPGVRSWRTDGGFLENRCEAFGTAFMLYTGLAVVQKPFIPIPH